MAPVQGMGKGKFLRSGEVLNIRIVRPSKEGQLNGNMNGKYKKCTVPYRNGLK